MATYYSDKVDSTTGNKDLDKKTARALVGTTTIVATAVIDTALVASDTIELAVIPAGATITEIVLGNDNGLGTTMTLDVGDADDADRFIDGADFSGDATVARIDEGAGVGYTYSSETTLIATAATAASGTTDGTLKAVITYVVGN